VPEVVSFYDRASNYFAQYDYPDQERISFIVESDWGWYSGLPFAGDL
jgi:hypothetical protein